MINHGWFYHDGTGKKRFTKPKPTSDRAHDGKKPASRKSTCHVLVPLWGSVEALLSPENMTGGKWKAKPSNTYCNHIRWFSASYQLVPSSYNTRYLQNQTPPITSLISGQTHIPHGPRGAIVGKGILDIELLSDLLFPTHPVASRDWQSPSNECVQMYAVSLQIPRVFAKDRVINNFSCWQLTLFGCEPISPCWCVLSTCCIMALRKHQKHESGVYR